MRGLPAGWYVDPARGPLELPSAFLQSWQFVCHAADLPAPGTAARFDCGGRTAFVLRTREHALRAYRNTCSHRGARLVDGDPSTGLAFVLEGRVRCQYHGWCYDEQGRLVSIPAGQCFDDLQPAERALTSLPVAQWRGLVFVCLDAPARELDTSFGDAAASWPDAAPMRRLGEPRSVAIDADWKLACEHLLDTSHLRVAHSTPAPHVFEPTTFVAASADALRATGRAVDASHAAWPARAYLRGLGADAPPPAADFLFLWPNLLLAIAPDALAALQVLPTRTGACRVRLVRYGLPDTSPLVRRQRYLHDRAWRRILADAARRLERVQHGLGGLPPDQAPGLDAAQPGLHWFAERCRAAFAPAMPPTAKPRARRPRRVPAGVGETAP